MAPTTGALEPIDEHSCTLRAGSDSLDELAIYVTTKGLDFQVHEPPELVEHVRMLAAALSPIARSPHSAPQPPM
ncbi:WYL domain-containing protein [Streptomyces sp. ISL-96]|uniref:WYL domain-containing protein n=1 Tax=Streptomyces sp. ISL-96 TaxID=2819191 RepID=UPI0035ABBBB7